MDAVIGSKAHDIAWRQEEREDHSPSGPVCFICGDELTEADKKVGAEVMVEECAGFGKEWFPICVPCSGKTEATIWIPSGIDAE